MSDQPFDRIFQSAVIEELWDFADKTGEILKDCESPIEERFASAFMVHCALIEGRPLPKIAEHFGPRPKIILQPQYRLEPYRVDFLIYYAGTPVRECGVIVECDGHDFHEKTKEQAARDKARDRHLQSRAAKVLRFTGSEIHNRPFQCAFEAFGALDGVYCDWGGGR